MKTAQEVINYFRENDWCLNQSKMKLAIAAYNLGVDDANHAKDVNEQQSKENFESDKTMATYPERHV